MNNIFDLSYNKFVKISVWPKFKGGGGVNWTLFESFRKLAFQCKNTNSLKKLRMQSAEVQTINKYKTNHTESVHCRQVWNLENQCTENQIEIQELTVYC